ncbi:hypothetical protein GCM10023322_31470 [Rugosimonospora acidiphila]|uniref:SbsA Ig-like domain-containing protein n=1 Tax=Rugosimonospora acidiphila TaxID=556531 RepID=A0ABP9RS17_9ACTN
MEATWSSSGDRDCIRLSGLPAGDIRVYPASALALGTAPPMAGQLVRDGTGLCFIPRFPFVAGTAYAVAVNGVRVADLVRPRPPDAASTGVLVIYPTARVVPRNLLRFYVWFTAPMSEGEAARRVRLVNDAGEELPDALLPMEYELWDPERRRLTVLMEPARIKRGLAAHRAVGYPLRTGTPFSLEVDAGFRDANGLPLLGTTARRYQVDADERHRIDPAAWTLSAPPADSDQPLHIAFDRPLDHGLLARCLSVTAADGRLVRGTAEIGPGERWWRFTPDLPWARAAYRLVVDPVLEDLAGNSVGHVFDRDLDRAGDRTGPNTPVTMPFRPARG